MRTVVAATIGAAVWGCAGALHAPASPSTSRDYEPPQPWKSAVLFSFLDSTWLDEFPYGARIEFHDGQGTRSASGRDLFHHELGNVRTPWYRIWMPPSGEYATTIRVTISDASGQRSVAEYPLILKNDTFYFINFGVGTFDPGQRRHPGLVLEGLRAFPVPAGARRAPGDSLWISHVTSDRDCFHCQR